VRNNNCPEKTGDGVAPTEFADPLRGRLRGDDERSIGRDVAIGHSRGVEGEARTAIAVNEDQSARAVRAICKEADASLRRGLRCLSRTQQFGCRLCHHDFHDGFAPAGAGHSAGFRVRIAATADQRRVAHAAGEFAACPAGGSSCDDVASCIHGNGANSTVLMADVVFRSMFVIAALPPCLPLAFEQKLAGRTEGQALFVGKLFGPRADEKDVLARLQHAPCQADWIARALDRRHGARVQRRSIHHDRVKLHLPVPIQMRADAGVKCGIIFQYDDGGLHRIYRRAAPRKNLPAGIERAPAARPAIRNRAVGDTPCSAVDDEGWWQGIVRTHIRG
jgi:hypothetical protein